MRNLLALLAALLLLIGGAGWYLGWFKFHTEAAESGHGKVSIDINTQKMGQDLKKGEEKLQEIIKNASKTETKTTKDNPKDDKKKSDAGAIEADLRAHGLPTLPNPLYPSAPTLLTQPDTDAHPLVEKALRPPGR
jgi:hypothetical protein